MNRSILSYVKTPAQVDKARIAGKLAASVLQMIEPYVKPGISTDELDKLCHDFIVNELNAIPANIGYHGYTKTTCISVNHVICHGIPSDKILKKGDIVNVDVALIKDGWYGDTSRMFFAGEPSILARRLVDVTLAAMLAGIEQVRPGATLGDIGFAIESIAHRESFSVVEEYCGHGIGQGYHEDPQVLHYGRKGEGIKLKEGMIFTIEPMINAGKKQTKVLNDGWTVITKDRSLSAQWEHMVTVTKHGYEILTPWP